MSKLRNQLIRLAYAKPELRPKLLPLIKEESLSKTGFFGLFESQQKYIKWMNKVVLPNLAQSLGRADMAKTALKEMAQKFGLSMKGLQVSLATFEKALATTVRQAEAVLNEMSSNQTKRASLPKRADFKSTLDKALGIYLSEASAHPERRHILKSHGQLSHHIDHMGGGLAIIFDGRWASFSKYAPKLGWEHLVPKMSALIYAIDARLKEQQILLLAFQKAGKALK